MKKTESDTYQCDMCEGVFEKGWSDEEAKQEYDETHTEPFEESAIICDNCFNKMGFRN